MKQIKNIFLFSGTVALFMVLIWTFDKSKDTSLAEKPVSVPIFNEVAEPVITIDFVKNTITSNELKEIVYKLASRDMNGRRPGTEGYEKAALFVEEEFKSYGLETHKQHFVDNRGDKTWNVIGILRGGEKAIVIGAHLDHLGGSSRGIYYGADDNASGSAALLEIAEALGKLKEKIKKTIIFVAFSSEERGLVGSRYYVNNSDVSNVECMINMDMVGNFKNSNRLYCGAAGNSRVLTKILDDVDNNYPFTAYAAKDISSRSDHKNFADKRIPVIFFHTGTDTGVYHTTRDTPDRLDYQGMEIISKFIFDLCIKLDNNQQRIDWIRTIQKVVPPKSNIIKGRCYNPCRRKIFRRRLFNGRIRGFFRRIFRR